MVKLFTVVGNWLDAVSLHNKLPESCEAILIGLFEGEHGYQIYISGSNVYDFDGDDWACRQDFMPEPRYLKTGVSDDVEWEEFQSEVVAAVRQVLSTEGQTLLHQVPHVSVGFDDGDLVSVK